MSEPTTWLVAVTAGGSTEHSGYRNGKDAHRAASERSRAPEADHATVTFNGCVTTYRDGIGTGPPSAANADPPAGPAPEDPPKPAKWRSNPDDRPGPTQVKNLQKAMHALLSEGKTYDELTGVTGGEERRWTMTAPFSPVRPEVVALHEAIKAKYGHEVTRTNAREITAEYVAALPEAEKSRPTEDKRITAGQAAAGEAERAAAEQAAAERAEPAEGCKRLTIKHTHEDGTLIYGTDKGDGVYEIVREWTGGHFRYFRSIRMIGIAQSIDHPAKRGQIDQAAKALRKVGHVVTVEIDDTPRDRADVKAHREERLDARYDRLTAKAERRQAEGDSRRAAADHYAQRFEGGQPILVGHHSERSARVAQKRMDGHDRAAHRAYSEAERAAAAASVVGKEEARRETPPRIRRRLDRLQAELRQTMHHINGTRPANDWRGAYDPNRKPASGAWLEQLTARRTFLEHQIAADEALLAEHKANGYVELTRETVHKGDVVTWASFPHDVPATVTRVNPKTVTLDRTRWPSKLGYEQIKTITCPHEGTETTVTARKPAGKEREPVTVKTEPPAERETPLEVGAGSQFFPTPAPVVERMLAAAGHEFRGMRVLEPSAGLGAIARPAAARGAEVDCIELDYRLAGKLREAGFTVQGADFLEVAPVPEYDRVLMNPPFAGQADIRHVTHALKFLRPGGLLVAVMSAGAEFRQDKTAEGFRELVAERGGRIERLPDGSFDASGTAIRTVLATIPAPAVAAAPTQDAAEAAGMLFVLDSDVA